MSSDHLLNDNGGFFALALEGALFLSPLHFPILDLGGTSPPSCLNPQCTGVEHCHLGSLAIDTLSGKPTSNDTLTNNDGSDKSIDFRHCRLSCTDPTQRSTLSSCTLKLDRCVDPSGGFHLGQETPGVGLYQHNIHEGDLIFELTGKSTPRGLYLCGTAVLHGDVFSGTILAKILETATR